MNRPRSEIIQVGKIVESRTVDRQGVIDHIDTAIVDAMKAGVERLYLSPKNIAKHFGYDESKSRVSSFHSHMIRDLRNAGYEVKTYLNHIEVDLT